MQIQLSPATAKTLLAVDPKTARDGGFQSLTVQLAAQTERATGVLNISDDDRQKIERYAKDYGSGGWQNLFDEILHQSKK